MPDSLKETKRQLRVHMLSQRRRLPAGQILEESNIIAGRFCRWEPYLAARRIMVYLAMPEEPQTDSIILDALSKGKQVCVPLLGDKFGEMTAARIFDLNSLITGRLGLKMPDRHNSEQVAPAEIDLVIVPGVAFDCAGNRLGMGAGYYDRFLPETRGALLLGLAWSFQIVPQVPSEPHDIQMNYLLTEKGFETCLSK